MTAIPPMTDPMGRNWDQPSPDLIEVDDVHALMTPATLKALLEYSSSIPSGVYEGKMWKRHDGVYDAVFLRNGGKPKWLLCWYGPSADPEKCSINSREVLLV